MVSFKTIGMALFAGVVAGFQPPVAFQDRGSDLTRVSYACAPVLERYADLDPRASGRADELFSRGQLPEALAIAPYVGRTDNSPHSMSQLDGLVSASHAILIGTITRQACYVGADSKVIIAASTVRVDFPLKGPIAPGEFVTIGVVGGRINFAGAKWAQTRPLKRRFLESGERVITFLIASDIVTREALASGGQPTRLFHPYQAGNGTFTIGSQNRMTPLLFEDVSNAHLNESFRGRPVDALVDAVKRLLEKQ